MKDIENTRKIVGRYGITGKQQTTPIGCLSDGQRVSWPYSPVHVFLVSRRSRVALASERSLPTS
jgi:hypothetical protein